MMTSAVQCIIILACTAILTSSAAPIFNCRCLNSGKGARAPLSDIVSTAEYAPRPYCNKKEVIITLKNGREMCLDPTERYTKAVLQRLKAREAAKNTTTSKPATAPKTSTATVSASPTTAPMSS